MAKKLTEEMVIARTKISDLSKIKRLNCWGSELGDVSLLRQMPSVEVLSLSINKISSLEDFALCKRLEELYIRQNEIRDLNQIVYLQALPNLKHLWLGENPCASIEGYRPSVLRALPQLQKLDNVAVTPDELKEAQRRGRVLCHPEDDSVSEEEHYVPQQQQQRYQQAQQDYPSDNRQYSPQRSPSRQDVMSPPRRQVEQVVHRRAYSPEPQEYADQRRRSSHDLGSPTKYAQSNAQQYYDRSPPYQNNDDSNNGPTEHYKEPRLVTSQSTNSILKEYTNGDRYVPNQIYKQQTEGSEMSYGTDGRRDRQFTPCAATSRPPFIRRPVTRNSNILSAVLCLVKELDYPSLEVVEMAVRCRMDELDE